MYNEEQIKDLIGLKLNNEQCTETSVLEEADRVERQGPAPPPEKSTVQKPTDKKGKKGQAQHNKGDSMYRFLLKLGGYRRVHWRVYGGSI